MVATGWVWSRAEERVHLSGEREIQEREEKLRALRAGVLVFKLGLLGTSQWLS